MSDSIRPMRAREARRFLEIQRASVRDIAAKDYPRRSSKSRRRCRLRTRSSSGFFATAIAKFD